MSVDILKGLPSSVSEIEAQKVMIRETFEKTTLELLSRNSQDPNEEKKTHGKIVEKAGSRRESLIEFRKKAAVAFLNCAEDYRQGRPTKILGTLPVRLARKAVRSAAEIIGISSSDEVPEVGLNRPKLSLKLAKGASFRYGLVDVNFVPIKGTPYCLANFRPDLERIDLRQLYLFDLHPLYQASKHLPQ